MYFNHSKLWSAVSFLLFCFAGYSYPCCKELFYTWTSTTLCERRYQNHLGENIVQQQQIWRVILITLLATHTSLSRPHSTYLPTYLPTYMRILLRKLLFSKSYKKTASVKKDRNDWAFQTLPFHKMMVDGAHWSQSSLDSSSVTQDINRQIHTSLLWDQCGQMARFNILPYT